MKKVTLLLLTIFLATFTGPVRAADESALEALETLRHGFAETRDLTARITQEKHLSLMKRTLVSRGIVRFKKPESFYMELFSPHGSKLLLKDNLMMIGLSERGGAEKVALPPEEGLRKWFAYLGAPVTALPEGVDVRAQRYGMLWRVHILPHGKGSVREVTLTCDNQGQISRIVIDERNGDRTILALSDVKINVGLKESDFSID